MRKLISHDRVSAGRRPSIVEALPEAQGVVTIEIDGTRHRLAPDEARAIARALLAGALVVSGRLDNEDLDSGDESSWEF